MGIKYYRVVKQKFCGSASAFNMLVVTNTAEPVNTVLMNAVIALKSQNCKKKSCLSF